MKPLSKELAVLLFGFGILGVAGAQEQGFFAPPDWAVECTDPKNTTPESNPYVANQVNNELMCCTLGANGTYTYGGSTGPCFGTPGGPESVPNAGKFCFSYGNWSGGTDGVEGVGSIQRYSDHFNSANLALNWGAPDLPGYAYACFVLDGGTPQYFGSTNSLFFRGFSNRYIFMSSAIGSVNINLQVELVADAVRLRWNLTNNETASHNIALWFGSGINMLTDERSKYYPNYGFVDPNSGLLGPDAAGFVNKFGYPTNSGRIFKYPEPGSGGTRGQIYVYLPNQRPPDTDITLDRTLNPATFPDYVDFLFGQSDPFGMRIETKPSDSTMDIPSNQPTKAHQIVLGKNLFVIDDITAGTPTFPGALIPDTGFLGEVGFIQKFDPVLILPGQSAQILNYIRSTWGNGNYSLPYGAVVDAPRLVQARDTNFDGSPAPTGLAPNPATFRVWVDNVGGFAFDQKEFPLNDVQYTLTFDNPGVTVIGPATQIIPYVAPRADAFRDYSVQIGPDVAGVVNYTVVIDSQPGTIHKVINGSFVVAARPRARLVRGANMITAPYAFSDSSWTSILAPYLDPTVAGGTALTYTWDPGQQGYVIAQSAQRGRGTWVIYSNSAKTAITANFGGNPQTPPGFNNVTQLIQLSPGWNMIGNPYNYAFPLSQVNGVTAGDPNVHTFQELVSLGFISNFVATWDPATLQYTFTNGSDGNLDPLKGYWIDVLTDNDMTFEYPPLFIEGLPGAARKAAVAKLSSTYWRMQLSAHMDTAVDVNNYVGLAATKADVMKGRIFKPPLAPGQQISFGVEDTINGKPHLLSTDLTTPSTSYRWNMNLYNSRPGTVVVWFPNLGTLPSNLKLKFVDETGSVVIDPRIQRSYTYTATKAGIRKFAVVAIPG